MRGPEKAIGQRDAGNRVLNSRHPSKGDRHVQVRYPSPARRDRAAAGHWPCSPAFADPANTSFAAPLAAASATHPGRVDLLALRAQGIAADPALAAIRQMRLMERIYLRQNQPEQAQRMYRDVLARTQDPMIRNVVTARLARLAVWQPRNLDGALVELKRGLDENLARLK
ncbi:MAG: hypothetical protein IPO66_19690 [Rhodanobacteraceae bacterium]|nr:hypothetical protein [Rhodanobacteraceae bacterium]